MLFLLLGTLLIHNSVQKLLSLFQSIYPNCISTALFTSSEKMSESYYNYLILHIDDLPD